MMKLSKDSKTKQRIYNSLIEKIPEITATKANEIVGNIVEILDKQGYHIGLPSDIEWALNSGDGVYRP